MVPRLGRRRVSVSPVASAGRARRFCRAGDPGTAIARPVPRRIPGDDAAAEYGAEPAEEPLPVLISSLEVNEINRIARQARRLHTSQELLREALSKGFGVLRTRPSGAPHDDDVS